MRGVKVVYRNLGTLLREGRERKGLSLPQAAMVLGLTNRQYVWRCESGTSNFPAKKLKRALELYRIPAADAIAAAASDFTESMSEFLRGKSK